jgi:hypothetical protein
MNPYRYTVSLRLWHPKRNLSSADAVFGLRSTHSWVRGQPRRTPVGTALSGVYSDSYWSARLNGERGASSRKEALESFVVGAIEMLRDRRSFLQRLRRSGGRAELFVGVYGERNFAIEFEPPLLRAAGALGLALSLDIYPRRMIYNSSLKSDAAQARRGSALRYAAKH